MNCYFQKLRDDDGVLVLASTFGPFERFSPSLPPTTCLNRQSPTEVMQRCEGLKVIRFLPVHTPPPPLLAGKQASFSSSLPCKPWQIHKQADREVPNNANTKTLEMHRDRVSYIHSHFLTPSLPYSAAMSFSTSVFTHNSYTVVRGYRSPGIQVFMVPVATGWYFLANEISVSMVTGCTRANLKESVVLVLPVFCIGMINHPHDQYQHHYHPQTPEQVPPGCSGNSSKYWCWHFMHFSNGGRNG